MSALDRPTWTQIIDTYRTIEPDADTRLLPGRADAWWAQEDACEWFIGCPDWVDRPALIMIVEAAKSLTGMDHKEAEKLLKLALKEIKRKKRNKT